MKNLLKIKIILSVILFISIVIMSIVNLNREKENEITGLEGTPIDYIDIINEKQEIINSQKQIIKDLTDQNKLLLLNMEILEEENAALIQETLYTDSEWEYLYRTATAEAGYNDKQAQKNVIYVILNRINDNDFPNDVISVITQKSQFSSYPYLFNKVEITDFTIENVKEAVADYQIGESAAGARFFTRGTFKRTYLFTDSVGHNFYK